MCVCMCVHSLGKCHHPRGRVDYMHVSMQAHHIMLHPVNMNSDIAAQAYTSRRDREREEDDAASPW
jgi:hypothetical protein